MKYETSSFNSHLVFSHHQSAALYYQKNKPFIQVQVTVSLGGLWGGTRLRNGILLEEIEEIQLD